MANEHPHALALPRHDRVGLRSTGPLGAAVCVVPCGTTVTLARKSTGTPRIGRQHPRGYRPTLGVGQLRLAHRHATACPGYQRRCAGVRRQPDEQGRVHRQRSARWLRGLLDAATLVSQGLGREDLGTADPASAAADPRHWPARQFVAKESDQQQLAASTAPAPTPLHGHEGRRVAPDARGSLTHTQRGSTDDSGDSAAYPRSWRSNRRGHRKTFQQVRDLGLPGHALLRVGSMRCHK